jgi:hypothetical protein
VAAPKGLREEIEHVIERDAATSPVRTPRTARRGLSSREIFAFASGIAAGIAFFAFLGQAFLPGKELDPESLSGAIAVNPHAGVLPVMDRRSLQDGDLRAEALVRSDPNFVIAEIDLTSPLGLEMVLLFDPTALALVGCERPAAVQGEVVLGSERLEIRNPQEGPYRFIFRKRAEHASSPLQLRLDRGDWSARESLGITPPPKGSPG